MTKQKKITVDYADGVAKVFIGGRNIAVARRDEDTLDYLCPVELISASLGS